MCIFISNQLQGKPWYDRLELAAAQMWVLQINKVEVGSETKIGEKQMLAHTIR